MSSEEKERERERERERESIVKDNSIRLGSLTKKDWLNSKNSARPLHNL